MKNLERFFMLVLEVYALRKLQALIIIKMACRKTGTALVLENLSGGLTAVDTPVPIPNTEVKRRVADGTTL